MKPILVINSGSSSLKFGLFVDQGGDEHLVVRGNADAIGSDRSTLEIFDEQGNQIFKETRCLDSQKEALNSISEQSAALKLEPPIAVGHRVVHGGPHLVTHQRITAEVLATLQRAVHFAPVHIPAAVEIIRHVERVFPQLPQFACFDTAFHQTMPEAVYRYPIPEKYFAAGVRRFGFHGLSYASIVHDLGKDLPSKVVIAHLGNGASLAAIADGKSVDTSMGLTPTGGIPMSTRAGDLDPGVPLFLIRNQKLDTDALETLLNHNSGLKALGGTNDMRELQKASDSGDSKAALAIEIFCRSIAKTIASFAAVLGGLDLLVFAGGIGEHSSTVRASVCDRLGFLGIALDAARNNASSAVISADSSKVRVRVMSTEEEKQIARYCRVLLQAHS
ncbi:acetate/propionate family kinase [Alloacidobacterium dinghuense]|uniref:Acetate kinase n=1 Tax=Alloacidobacterium dinghuense TaxID=2763107 RepID=A0A7G8BIE1_9BACT|nr:acetate/propionate family kinase [Alloacidobacterium dinghuense]QNI32311.1 acetate/propionate family kinase [Alloacidobacterium dinghuense]